MVSSCMQIVRSKEPPLSCYGGTILCSVLHTADACFTEDCRALILMNSRRHPDTAENRQVTAQGCRLNGGYDRPCGRTLDPLLRSVNDLATRTVPRRMTSPVR